MDKFEKLATMYTEIINVATSIHTDNQTGKKFLAEFISSLNKSKENALGKTNPNLPGASTGYQRWLSEYDNIIADDNLWDKVTSLEKYVKVNI
jgi:hypothetical protein